jgi:hypothetical protein
MLLFMADTSLYEKLRTLQYQPEQVLTIRKKVTLSEKGKHYLLSLNPPLQSAVYQIDGMIIAEGNRCDKMILADKGNGEWVQIFVELKGVDVAHAIVQLESTLQNKMLQHATNKEKRARIVAAAFPSNRANPKMEQAKLTFLKKYQCELRGLKSNQEDTPIKTNRITI